MRRREFIGLFGGAAAWPLAARAQPAAAPVIGFLNSTSAEAYARPVAAFRDGLRDAGFTEGESVRIEYRWADGHYDRLPALAADLVRRKVNVIYASGGDVSALAAKASTTTIPIIFSTGSDPVGLGLVDSLARPGGNLTGVSRFSIELLPKRLQLVREAVPKASIVVVLINPANPNATSLLAGLAPAAESLNLKLAVLKADTDAAIETAFAGIASLHADALIIGPDVFFNSRSDQLGALSARHGVPAIYQLREFVVAGGLMGLGPSLTDAFRTAAGYVGKILKGAKPADLPVEQQSRLELIVSLKAARTLGIEMPTSLLLRADEVIE
jgi:putative ABC transport system substrate-binding protein